MGQKPIEGSNPSLSTSSFLFDLKGLGAAPAFLVPDLLPVAQSAACMMNTTGIHKGLSDSDRSGHRPSRPFSASAALLRPTSGGYPQAGGHPGYGRQPPRR